ncbi:MAG TPA: type II secretion system secretin GspD [Hyphomicrobiaceae bacterium]
MVCLRARAGLLLCVLLVSASACGTVDIESIGREPGLSRLPRRDDATVAGGKIDTSAVLAKSDEAGKTITINGTGVFVGQPSQSVEKGKADEAAARVTLNLVNVPAAQAAKSILGDMLGVRYTIDPGVKGEITVQTPHPVTKAAAVDLFQAALRAGNAALVNVRGQYRIVPADQAVTGAPITVDGAPAGTQKLGSALHIVQLKYVAASEINRVLEPMAPRGGIVRADEARNTITLAGSPDEIASMREAIDIFDVDTMKGMSFALIPVTSSQPTAIADELRTVFAANRDGPMAGMVRFLPNNRLKAVLVITPQREYLARAGDWVRKLDAQARGTERQFYTYAVQNRRAQDLVSALQALFAGEGDAKSARNVTPSDAEAAVESRTFEPTEFLTSASGSRKMPARAPQGPAAGRQAMTVATVSLDEKSGAPRVKIAADLAKNALLIEATPADHERLMRVIGELDVMPNQVVIEATIAEVTLNDDLKMGVRWFFANKKNRNFTFTDAASGALSSVFPGFSYAMTTANLTTTLNALNKITDVKVISSPSLTVMDNSTAVLQIGDQVPITTASAIGIVTGNAPIVNSVSYKDTGVILSITPRINSSGRVLLEIEQEVSSVATTTSSTIDSPTIKQRRIKTSVFVKDGDALALGGMIQSSNSVSRDQVPILGDLPLLGTAFRSKDNEAAKTELLVVITPHVIRSFDEAEAITREFRRELAVEAQRPRPPPRALATKARRTLE